MEIVFHAHHAVISDALRARAERIVHKAAARLHRTVGATVRFEGDGPAKRIEIVLHAPTQRPVIAVGEGRLFGPALSVAAAHLQVQIAKTDIPRVRARRTATAVLATGTLEDRVTDASGGDEVGRDMPTDDEPDAEVGTPRQAPAAAEEASGP